MLTCPECGKEITRQEALDGYCSMCGYRFPSKKQAPTMLSPSCPECGKEITNQDQLNGFCSMCGAILPSKSSNPPPPPASSSRDESFHGFNRNSSFHDTSDTQSQTDIYLSRISRDVSMILEYVKWIFGIIASIVALSVLGALIWFWSNL